MAIIELKAEEFDKEASENELFILDFYKDNCGPCAALRGVLEEISPLEGTPQIYSVNTGTETELVSRFSIMTAPALLFIKNGEVKKKTIGFKSKESILSILESL